MVELIFDFFALVGQRIFKLLPSRIHRRVPPDSGLGQFLGIVLGWLMVIGTVILYAHLK
jgi:hypothetical protein